MNPIQKLGLCLVLPFFGLGAEAQIQNPPPPTVWQCQAECFGLEGSDASTMVYQGPIETDSFYDRDEAFRQLKSYCDGIVVVRKLKGTQINEKKTDAIDWDDDWTVHHRWYSLRVLHHSTRVRIYQIVDREMRAIFEVNEATSTNACTPQSIYSQPIWTTPNGDSVRG